MATTLMSPSLVQSARYCYSTTASAHPMKLQRKVAIVTGGASGIGASTARLFAYHGARVLIADIQDEAGRRLAEYLGPNCQYIHCDVSSEDQVAECVDHATSTFGNLDIMFNNAGVIDTYRGKMDEAYQPITETDAAVFDHVTNVNMKGTMYGVKHAAKAMIAAGNSQGCILNMCSICAVVAQRTFHSYAVSKHAILGITKTAASELGGHGIRVNCISPVGIFTLMVAQSLGMSKEQVERAFVASSELAGRKLEMEDVANAALFLCSTDANYISGHNLVLDGGLSASKPFNPFKKPY